MITGIIPIWVTHTMLMIFIKLDRAHVLDDYNKKYHVYDHEFGTYIYDEKQRRNTWQFCMQR